jgi:hypothetical protein
MPNRFLFQGKRLTGRIASRRAVEKAHLAQNPPTPSMALPAAKSYSTDL